MNKYFRRFTAISGEFIQITFIMAGVLVLTYLFIGQLLEVSGDSMFPTFRDKEQLVAEKLSIQYREVQRGEVIIFEHPQHRGVLLIKRVVGIPGDTIMVLSGSVHINGTTLSEPYLQPNTKTSGGSYLKEGIPQIVASEHYIVMGDNREKSTDSRYWGEIMKSNIVGRGLAVYYPLTSFRFLR